MRHSERTILEILGGQQQSARYFSACPKVTLKLRTKNEAGNQINYSLGMVGCIL